MRLCINKKGSMFVILVFAAIILGIFFLIAFQRGELSRQQQERGAEQTARDMLTSYSDMVKLYTFMALRHSATKAANESMADAIGVNYWLAYGVPNAPTLSQAKDHVEQLTFSHLRGYLRQLDHPSNRDYGDVRISESGEITSIEIIETANDYFAITAEGTEFRVEIIDEPQSVIDRHNYTAEINPVRYFMIRRFVYQWLDIQDLTRRLCNKMALSKGWVEPPSTCRQPREYFPYLTDADVDTIVYESVEMLQNSMGPDVECSYEFNTPIHIETTYPQSHCTCWLDCPDGFICQITDCNAPGSCSQMDDGRYKPCTLGPLTPPSYTDFDDPPPELHGSVTPSNRNVLHDRSQDIRRWCSGWGTKHEIAFEVRLICSEELYRSPVGPLDFVNLTLDTKIHVNIKHEISPPPSNVLCDNQCILDPNP